MAKGIWRKRIDALVEHNDSSNDSSMQGLKDAERHHEIIREKLTLSLRASVLSPMLSAAKYHAELSDQLNDLTDVIVANSERDGMDLDGEMLDLLTDISGKLYAVEKTWNDIHDLLNKDKGN